MNASKENFAREYGVSVEEVIGAVAAFVKVIAETARAICQSIKEGFRNVGTSLAGAYKETIYCRNVLSHTIYCG